MKIIWLLVALMCGAVLPIQAGLNTRLGKTLGSPAYASMFSFIVGALAVALYLQFTKQSVNWTVAKSASPVSWLGGGLTGAFFITASMLALPRIGMALTFGLVVAGQMIMAVSLDHLGVLVDQPHLFNGWRFLGILLIVGGVTILRLF